MFSRRWYECPCRIGLVDRPTTFDSVLELLLGQVELAHHMPFIWQDQLEAAPRFAAFEARARYLALVGKMNAVAPPFLAPFCERVGTAARENLRNHPNPHFTQILSFPPERSE